MPIYEYQCTECGHELEKLQKLSDPPLTLCPACNKPALKKRISAAGFRLKGGGWYETDFKSKASQRNVAKADSSSKSGGDTGSKPASTDTKKTAATKTAATKTAATKTAATKTAAKKTGTKKNR